MSSKPVHGKFLSQLAHDLRSPLNVIGSTLSELQRQPAELTPDEQVAMLSLASRSVARLLAISDRLSVAGRLEQESPETHAHLQAVDLTQLVQQAVAQFSRHEKRSRIELVTVWPEQPVLALADPMLLGHLLPELLANANRHGRRMLRIEVFSDDRACLAVEDDGDGIAPQDRETMFEPFVERSTRGLGLGLWLAQTLARQQNGMISWEPSRLPPRIEGKPGTRMVLQLKLVRDESPAR